MRKYFSFLGIIAVLWVGLSFPAQAEELVILHTNDTHSNLFPFGPHGQYGGIARMSSKIKHLRDKNSNVLALHAGDMYVGTFAFNKYLGYPEFKIMEGLYDAMCLGNHELDLGPDILGAVLGGFNPIEGVPFGPDMSLPILSANIDLSGFPVTDFFVHPWLIKDIGGLKIGVLGVVTNDPIYYTSSTAPLISNPYLSAEKAALDLRNRGCHVVIAVSHLGMTFDKMFLSGVPEIDIIVGGHSHDEMLAQIIGGKIIVQAGEFGKNLGELKVDVDTTSGAVSLLSHELHPIDRKVRKDPALLNYLNELRVGIYQDPRFGQVYSRHVAKAMWDHEERWLPNDPFRDPSHMDTPLGNLVADAIRAGVEEAGYPVDIALEANGYIGHKIYEGKVVGNDVMRSLPYGFDPDTGLGFKIKIVNLYGAELYGGLEYTVSMIELADDISLQVSGLKFEFSSARMPPNRVDPDSIRINGSPLIPFELYTIAMNEKLMEFLGGLPGMDLTGRVVDPAPDLLEFNLIKDHMKKLNHLRYTSEGRIIDKSK
ncbi:MAG: bifunctional metallophosphatase/5'-nucleotidase [Candidatus Aminicenantes bacterium]|nr:MAG: bifunctional metallophosphatase/5'-nucleotidase [Candidatus Aminicenantes bacterium]